MNCLEFRRRMTIDPMSRDADLLEHESKCPDCASFARELRADEIRLRSLLRAVAPPEGMADRIQLAAAFERRAEVRRRWWYMAAASVLLAIGVSLFTLQQTPGGRVDRALAASVIHHIEDEADHLRAAQPVSAGRLRWVFQRFDAELTADIGPVHFAAECLMRSRNGVHLVLPGSIGPITVLLMPGEMAEQRMPVDSDRFSGHIVPTDWGSIAVVGEHGESLDGMGERLAAAVRWPRAAADSGPSGLGLVGRLGGRGTGQQQDG